eukprot:g4089.t1
MRRLETAIQRYAWGKSGSNSMVAQLKKSEDSDFDVDEDQTYAELWLGTHPNGPSRVVRDGHEGTDELQLQGMYGSAEGPGMFLIELLETYPHYLGDQEGIGDLPFMFKVLSINKALSIQAHPDKKLAERLYATRPDLYKDDNHKPEMAVALSGFEGLCGFRPFREIVYNLEIYPELRDMVGPEATAQTLACTSGAREDEQEALRVLFRAFVTANTDVVRTQVSALVRRLRGESRPTPGEEQIFDGSLCFQSPRGGGGSGGGNGGHKLSSCREGGRTFGHGRETQSDHAARHRNADADLGAIFEGGNDVIEAEMLRAQPGRGDLEVEVGGLDSNSTEKEEMQQQLLLHMGDGGSDDTADTADGATDHEDVHTEEDDSGSLPPDPNDEENENGKSGNTSSTTSTSSTSSASSTSSGGGDGTSSHNSSSSNMSNSNPNSDTEANTNRSAAGSDRHRGRSSGVRSSLTEGAAPTVSPRGRRHLAPPRDDAAAAASSGMEEIQPSAFRRRGWSSSRLALSDAGADADITVRRRASEDLALQALILRLAEEYPGDIGIMMPLLLNYLRMGEGESFFMAANEPHAYLKGDILEVMARSDNVVRVALTPKHRDVPLLCEILTYHMGAPPIVTPVAVDECCSRYSPPIKDFEMLDIEVPHGREYATPPAPVAALAIVMAGTGFACDGNGRQRLCRGAAFFVPARTPIVYANNSAGARETLWVCLARSNLHYNR